MPLTHSDRSAHLAERLMQNTGREEYAKFSYIEGDFAVNVRVNYHRLRRSLAYALRWCDNNRLGRCSKARLKLYKPHAAYWFKRGLRVENLRVVCAAFRASQSSLILSPSPPPSPPIEVTSATDATCKNTQKAIKNFPCGIKRNASHKLYKKD